MFIFDTKRQSASGGAERERETESEGVSRLWAVSMEPDNTEMDNMEPDVGLEPTNHEIMTWAEVGSSIDWATQAPQLLICF